MTTYNHPIAHHWIKQTLVPFLLFAFSSTLPYSVDISEAIQRLIDFALTKPDHPSDGDDMIFERIFMAIMHRHKNLAPDLTLVVDNLEPCAKFLIRRAQLKGPFELLERTDIGSSAWIEHEWQRLSNLMVERKEAEGELRPPVRPPSAATKCLSIEDDIDPRLVHAQPGHFTAADLSGQLTAAENSYYRQQNRTQERTHIQRQHSSINTSAAPAQTSEPSYAFPRRDHSHTTSVRESPYSQQQQRIPQQLSVPSVYTPQQAFHRTLSSHGTGATAQIQQHMQVMRPHAKPSADPNATAPSRRYVHEQHAWPQVQSAPIPPAQHDNLMQAPRSFSALPQAQPLLLRMNAQQQPTCLPQFQIQPSQYQPGQQQTTQHGAAQQQQALLVPGSRQIPQAPHAIPQTPRQSALQPQQTPPPTIARKRISSSDFTHLRGNDWSNAAQQRAREVAAKITAQERDSMARSIIQRQQSITQQTPSLASAASMYTPTNHVPQLPPRSRSAMGLPGDRTDRVHLTTPSYANASPYAHAPANLPKGRNETYTRGTAASPSTSGWGMAKPTSGTPLPTLAEVRSRYQPSQLPSSTTDIAEGTLTSAEQICGGFLGLASPVQAQYALFQQSQSVQQSWADGRADALQQLRHAAGQSNTGLVQTLLGGGADGSRDSETDVTGSRFKEEGKGDVEMHGM